MASISPRPRQNCHHVRKWFCRGPVFARWASAVSCIAGCTRSRTCVNAAGYRAAANTSSQALRSMA